MKTGALGFALSIVEATPYLPPGRYGIAPQPVEGLLGIADPVDVEVIDEPLEVNFSYDTGIR